MKPTSANMPPVSPESKLPESASPELTARLSRTFREPQEAGDAARAASGNVQGAMAAVTADTFDALAAVGGWRGITESVLPTLIFLVCYLSTHNTLLAVGAALVICVAAIAVRLVQRAAVTPAVGGFLAMAISAFLAWKTGEAANVFLWGILTNVAYLLVLVISMGLRWPLLGVVIAAVRGEGQAWRTSGQLRQVRRRYYQITWIWAALFAVRLAVELPLYFAGATEALGVAKLVLGVPLFALAVWFSWLLARSATASK